MSDTKKKWLSSHPSASLKAVLHSRCLSARESESCTRCSLRLRGGGEVVGRWWREGGEIMGRWYGDPACDEDEGGGEGGEQRAGASECGHSGQQRAWSGLGLG